MSRTISYLISIGLLLEGMFFGMVLGNYAEGAFCLVLSHICYSSAKEERR